MQINIRNITATAKIVLIEAKRKKDFYVVFIFSALLIAILSSISFFDLKGTVRYVMEIALNIMWLFSIVATVFFTAKQIPAELENHTILPLLAKPISKTEFILGKLLGSWLAISLGLMIFYIFFIFFSILSKEPFILSTCLQAYILHIFFVLLIASFSLTGSIIFSKGANITLNFILIFTCFIFAEHLKVWAITLPALSQISSLVCYYALPHLEFFDIKTLVIHAWQPMPALIALSCILYAIIYSAIVIGVGVKRFNKK